MVKKVFYLLDHYIIDKIMVFDLVAITYNLLYYIPNFTFKPLSNSSKNSSVYR
jgi:hypothetical protein